MNTFWTPRGQSRVVRTPVRVNSEHRWQHLNRRRAGTYRHVSVTGTTIFANDICYVDSTTKFYRCATKEQQRNNNVKTFFFLNTYTLALSSRLSLCRTRGAAILIRPLGVTPCVGRLLCNFTCPPATLHPYRSSRPVCLKTRPDTVIYCY